MKLSRHRKPGARSLKDVENHCEVLREVLELESVHVLMWTRKSDSAGTYDRRASGRNRVICTASVSFASLV